ncbi:hypothetical protein NP493_1252g00030 [Ridgeia piscesae]|uniref:Uncharacterized protein n=1 Tax=Ridgeia piscesae TaxID=27915 RepID=A0AAD9KAV5_RIDPI|nr:hypothetical protein NP493_1252g00030 [Ridgeia piscesae]
MVHTADNMGHTAADSMAGNMAGISASFVASFACSAGNMADSMAGSMADNTACTQRADSTSSTDVDVVVYVLCYISLWPFCNPKHLRANTAAGSVNITCRRSSDQADVNSTEDTTTIFLVSQFDILLSRPTNCSSPGTLEGNFPVR